MIDFEKKIALLEKSIGYVFSDKTFVKMAITHSSFSNESKETFENYERLEFLGDAVLGMIVAQYLFENYHDMKEGAMTKLRASVVCEESIAKCSRNVGVNNVLVLSNGEAMHGGRDKDSILADVFEAILASVYLDGGLEAARAFVLYHLKDVIDSTSRECVTNDYKSELQEILQSGGNSVKIEYVLDGEMGPDHDRTFFVSVYVNGEKEGEGTGKSKKAAQQAAAKIAIAEVMKNENIKV